ncbi:MAG: Gfo/Idh/MocA family oxidoreductase [Elusimicrobiota bacterium]|jgi:predicted dehydrogenase|nr:Gfo/Idh/MocA family oxidoreductase [Elusimicrobiota bacterium]
MKTVTWGMIGCGAVTEKKSTPALYKSEHSKLKSIYATQYEKAADYAKRHNVSTVCKSADEIFQDKEIDAVYIATPPKFHKDYAIACLKAGKIPYIEKPLGLNYQECLDILDASKKYNLPVFTAYYRRGMEKYIFIKSLIDSNALGKILFVRLNHFLKPEPCDLDRNKLPWRLIPEQTGGGKFIDMVTHVLDITEYFFGNLDVLGAAAQNRGGLYDVEDTVIASLKSQSGVLISGCWCYAADFNNEEMLIAGSKGAILTSGLYYDSVKVRIDGKEEIKEFKEPEHVAMPYMQMVINEIAGGAKSPADILSAANNVRIIDEILKEYRRSYSNCKVS